MKDMSELRCRCLGNCKCEHKTKKSIDNPDLTKNITNFDLKK